jgi:ribosome-binding protein aMBF1 (putative translation factor)
MCLVSGSFGAKAERSIMSATLIIPAEFVGAVRKGVFYGLRCASEAHAETGRPRKLSERFAAAGALLDAIGWDSSDPPIDAQVNMGEHGATLLAALRSASSEAAEALENIARGRAPAQRQSTIRHAHALREFVLALKVQANALEWGPPNATLTVPAEMVGHLRKGAYIVLGHAAHAIAQITERPDRERHPERYEEPREHFNRICALLDLIGWGDPEQATDIRVDLREHRWALTEALDEALKIADADMEEADVVDAARAERGQAPKRADTIERVLALREFAATAKAQADALEGGQGSIGLEQHEWNLVALGQAIRQTRAQQGVSTSELAAATGVEQQCINALESGELDPAFDLLLALADGLGVRPSTFVIRAEELQETRLLIASL